MKKIKGIRLVLLGVVLYTPYFIWLQISGNPPIWLFYISATLFGICIVVGLAQIVRKKDDALDDDMMKEVNENRNKAAQKGFLRFGR